MTYFEVNPFENEELWDQLYTERKQEIISQLTNCKALQAIKENGNTFIFHPSAKQKGYYQITYFDAKGPICDIQRETVEEMVQEIINYDYKVLEVIH